MTSTAVPIRSKPLLLAAARPAPCAGRRPTGPKLLAVTHPSWDLSYTGEEAAPWDIGRPQPAFARLAANGLLTGVVLDAGCGTGEHSLLAAASGADAVVGVDVSAVAIERARVKAAERGLTVRFEIADALRLDRLGVTFDTVIDSGLFHVLDGDGRAGYVRSLATALRTGGTCYLMCFSDRQPGDFGPRRVTEAELRDAFSDGWVVADIVADTFDINRGPIGTQAQAWRATLRRS
jgi:SAM-dependent methyltransferase